MRRLRHVLLLLALLPACGEAPGEDTHAPHHMPESMVPLTAPNEVGPIGEGYLTRADIEATFSRDGDWWQQSSARPLPGAGSRASVLLEIEGDVPPTVRAQAGWANQQHGPWLTLEEVWAEGRLRVFAVDLETAATTIRFAVDHPEGLRALHWSVNLPLAPELRAGALADAPARVEDTVGARGDWQAEPARCGIEAAATSQVVLTRVPAPAAAGAPWIRALQAHAQLGRGWCDLDPSYLVGQDRSWVGRAPRRIAEARGASSRVAVTILGCEADAETSAELVDLLEALTEAHQLSSAPQFAVADSLCAPDRWLEEGLASWIASDPFSPPPDPPQPPAEGVVQGTVISSDGGAALDDVQVRCDCGVETRTGSDGRFEVRAAPGRVSLAFEKRGFALQTRTVEIRAGETTALDLSLTPDGPPDPPEPPDTRIAAIDHSFLITHFGGQDVDPLGFVESQAGLQDYLTQVGVIHFAAWEYVEPNNSAVAQSCGLTLLLPPRDMWRRAAALGLLADRLRVLVNEPITLRNWWRPPCYNSGVGGAANGDHPDGDALDLDFRSARSRADAQRFLCEQYWGRDIVAPEHIVPGSNLNPRLNMSVGLGGATIHLGLLSRNGRRFWKYSSYSTLTNSGSCW